MFKNLMNANGNLENMVLRLKTKYGFEKQGILLFSRKVLDEGA